MSIIISKPILAFRLPQYHNYLLYISASTLASLTISPRPLLKTPSRSQASFFPAIHSYYPAILTVCCSYYSHYPHTLYLLLSMYSLLFSSSLSYFSHYFISCSFFDLSCCPTSLALTMSSLLSFLSALDSSRWVWNISLAYL